MDSLTPEGQCACQASLADNWGHVKVAVVPSGHGSVECTVRRGPQRAGRAAGSLADPEGAEATESRCGAVKQVRLVHSFTPYGQRSCKGDGEETEETESRVCAVEQVPSVHAWTVLPPWQPPCSYC